MSRPARSVGPDESVAHAMVVCQRHAQSGILVVEDGRIVERGTHTQLLARRGRYTRLYETQFRDGAAA